MTVHRYLLRFLPSRDLARLDAAGARRDVLAALAVTVLSVPQGVAYAMIAGLPPAMGLYAAVLPAVVGGLFRSSRDVVTGPTNAVSLLIGTAVASLGTGLDPATVALTLALLVGALQVTAGLLNLGALVDFISSAVVLGYITGAGVLIGLGQLPNVTGTVSDGVFPHEKLLAWVGSLPDARPLSVVLALGTAAGLLVLRRFAPRAPGAVIAMGVGVALSYTFDLGGHGFRLVRDLAPIPAGLPPFTLPSLGAVGTLMPMAVAVMVLSLVEGTSVARALARRSGQQVDTSVEFSGQGLANLAAAFTGGYPVSGSLARSSLSQRMGATSRLSGVLSGVGVLLVLLFAAPLVDHTPVASLAGLLLVIAADLVDPAAIRSVLRSRPSDSMAFLGTLIGTFVLPLDQAIYLGVAISLVLFLRRARMLVVRELAVDGEGRLREVEPGEPEVGRCGAVRILHVEGSLFFAAATELRAALEEVVSDPAVRVLVVRLKRTRGLDYTTALVLEDVHAQLALEDRHLLLVGLRPEMVDVMERVGSAEEFGEDLYPTRPGWFVAMHEALDHAMGLVGEHEAGCPLQSWLASRPELPEGTDPAETAARAGTAARAETAGSADALEQGAPDPN